MLRSDVSDDVGDDVVMQVISPASTNKEFTQRRNDATKNKNLSAKDGRKGQNEIPSVFLVAS